MKTGVHLADRDLATLINSEDVEVRAAAKLAAARLAAPARWSAVPSHVAALIADVIAEGEKNGRLIWQGESVSYCRYCDARSEWKKPPRRKNEVEYKLSGVEFAYRFVVVRGFISVGGCRACVDQALPILREELSGLAVELPRQLHIEGAPVHRRWERVRCKDCGWTGHEGQLGKMNAIMGGTYPGKCPSCGAEHHPLGRRPFENIDGFEVVVERAA